MNFAELAAEHAGQTLVWRDRGRTRRARLARVDTLRTHTVAHISTTSGRRRLVLAHDAPITLEP